MEVVRACAWREVKKASEEGERADGRTRRSWSVQTGRVLIFYTRRGAAAQNSRTFRRNGEFPPRVVLSSAIMHLSAIGEAWV